MDKNNNNIPDTRKTDNKTLKTVIADIIKNYADRQARFRRIGRNYRDEK